MFNKLKNKILVLDGATGTEIQNYNLTEEDFRGKSFENHKKFLKGCNEILNITNPSIIKDIHFKYMKAGADIIETNSFNANKISLEEYNLQEKAYEIAKKSAVFESRIRQSMNPSYNSPPPLESHTRPLQSSFFSPRETLGIENRFSAINNCRESMLSNVSEDYGMDLQEVSSSDDDLETEKSRRDRMFRM